MTARTLYLVRHGERLDTHDRTWYENQHANKYDPPLSDHGKQQAQQLAQHLRHAPIQHIFSSPYWRALQTAHPIAQALQLPLYVEAGIGEWLGRSMISQEPTITPAYQRRDEFPELDFSHHSRRVPHYPESVTACFDRLEQTVVQFLTAYDGNLLLVGHGRTVTGIAHRLVGKPEGQFKYQQAGLTTLTFEGTSWQLGLNSDITHLQQPGRKPQFA